MPGSADTASTPKKARPVAVDVSTLCSSTLKFAPASSIASATLARSRNDRPRRVLPSVCGTEDEALGHHAIPDEVPKCNEQLARQGHDHLLA